MSLSTRVANTTPDLAAVSAAVERYFAGFNTEDYRAVATLFETDGALLAPFEEPIVGPEAIYIYLQAEALNMRATPVQVEATPHPDGGQQVVVKGRVKTLLFTVNVRWTFELTAADTVRSAEIKLLASLQELMQLDRG
ncbi:ketosteroid isomerase family protein [Leptolyngbya sp. KIOST-1]|uniref:ketosteroid isomerase family protein n=1 Tax=Leptolyngbya sp. KIOST-1 TaxID=1229172 RepID=UPI0005646656|nr:ketosteroid isomerase family protein [Leptolyngbya sp. KIOST-1]